MLIFTRKKGESVTLSVPGFSEKIIVKVTSLGDKKCKLAISAPKEIKVLRKELEGKDAANSL